jgi:hypothetical protein
MDLKQLASLLACLSLTACTANAISPPGRTTPLETAAAIGQGEVGVQGEVGLSASLFGPSLSHATARVRVGVLAQTDVSVEANVAVVRQREPTSTHRGIYSLRGGVKHAFTPHFAVVAGLGLGASAGGGFVSPDIGVVAGYENPYFVPFFGARLVLSQPIAPQQVTLPQNESDDELEYIVDTPEFTYGFATSFGARIPFHQPGRVAQHAFLFGVSVTGLWDTDHERSYRLASFTAGFELVL